MVEGVGVGRGKLGGGWRALLIFSETGVGRGEGEGWGSEQEEDEEVGDGSWFGGLAF